MDLSPEMIDAVHSQYDAMGFGFYAEALVQYGGDELEALASSMALPTEEMASLLIQRFTVLQIEHWLPKCVRQLVDATMITMPRDDLRFVCGYMALEAAGVPIKSDQTKRAIQIAHKLSAAGEGNERPT